MALRSTWKGYLQLSLVSCAVALYPAATSTSSERVSFHVLDDELTAIRIESGHTIDIDAQRGRCLAPGQQKKACSSLATNTPANWSTWGQRAPTRTHYENAMPAV